VIVTILVLFVLPLVVNVRCPVCGGSGKILVPAKLPSLNLTSISLTAEFGCDIDSFLDINITASNNSSENETGLASLVVTTTSGQGYSFPVTYDVAAHSTELIVREYDIPINYQSKIETNLTSPAAEGKVIKCPFCDGTGGISMLKYTYWALTQTKFEI
jgi:hypothetical protein